MLGQLFSIVPVKGDHALWRPKLAQETHRGSRSAKCRPIARDGSGFVPADKAGCTDGHGYDQTGRGGQPAQTSRTINTSIGKPECHFDELTTVHFIRWVSAIFQKKHTIRPLGNRKLLLWQPKPKPPARKPIFVGKHFQITFNVIKKQGSVQVQNPGAKRLRSGWVDRHRESLYGSKGTKASRLSGVLQRGKGDWLGKPPSWGAGATAYREDEVSFGMSHSDQGSRAEDRSTFSERPAPRRYP
jgi:hypothetical protein